jgi:hypothetical protein
MPVHCLPPPQPGVQPAPVCSRWQALPLHVCPPTDPTARLPAGQDAEVARITMPPHHFCGEAVFVPRSEAPVQGCSAEEDEGYLITYVHDEVAGRSTLNVYDARSMAQEPLAVVALPQRVPYGFHGLWVSESQVAAQGV